MDTAHGLCRARASLSACSSCERRPRASREPGDGLSTGSGCRVGRRRSLCRRLSCVVPCEGCRINVSGMQRASARVTRAPRGLVRGRVCWLLRCQPDRRLLNQRPDEVSAGGHTNKPASQRRYRPVRDSREAAYRPGRLSVVPVDRARVGRHHPAPPPARSSCRGRRSDGITSGHRERHASKRSADSG